jgi:hypothetical protein
MGASKTSWEEKATSLQVVEMYVCKWAQGGSGENGNEEGRSGYEWKRVDGEDRNVVSL